MNPEHLEPVPVGQHRRDTVRSARSQLSANDVIRIRNEAAAGRTFQSIALEYQAQWTAIREIVAGRTWAEVGGPIGTPERHCNECGTLIVGRRRSARFCCDTHKYIYNQRLKRGGTKRSPAAGPLGSALLGAIGAVLDHSGDELQRLHGRDMIDALAAVAIPQIAHRSRHPAGRQIQGLEPTPFEQLVAEVGSLLGEASSEIDPASAAVSLLRLHLREHGFSREPRAIQSSIDALRDFADERRIRLVLEAPLLGFAGIDGEEVQLAPHATVGASGSGAHSSDAVRPGTTPSFALRVHGVCDRTTLQHDVEAMQRRMATVVSAFRMLHEGAVAIREIDVRVSYPTEAFVESIRPTLSRRISEIPELAPRGVYSFTADDAGTIRGLVDQLEGRIADDRVFRLALRRFERSYEREPLDDRVVDTWVALEALFTPDATSELRFRASSRIARFVGRDRGEREAIMTLLRTSYDLRSHLVHGGDPTRFGRDLQKRLEGLGGAESVVERTEDVLRRALRLWLGTGQGSSQIISDIDGAMLA